MVAEGYSTFRLQGVCLGRREDPPAPGQSDKWTLPEPESREAGVRNAHFNSNLFLWSLPCCLPPVHHRGSRAARGPSPSGKRNQAIRDHGQARRGGGSGFREEGRTSGGLGAVLNTCPETVLDLLRVGSCVPRPFLPSPPITFQQ